MPFYMIYMDLHSTWFTAETAQVQSTTGVPLCAIQTNSCETKCTINSTWSSYQQTLIQDTVDICTVPLFLALSTFLLFKRGKWFVPNVSEKHVNKSGPEILITITIFDWLNIMRADALVMNTRYQLYHNCSQVTCSPWLQQNTASS